MSQLQENLHLSICKNIDELQKWFADRANSLSFPFYSSFDIRDSGFKIAPVDANLYPAGFNNICDVDKEHSVTLAQSYLAAQYPEINHPIVLLTEEHTKNPYYWENIVTLKNTITEAGYEVVVAIPALSEKATTVTSLSGTELAIKAAEIKDNTLYVDDWSPELIVCNNDFSNIDEAWQTQLTNAINPPPQMGWHARRKIDFFNHYNNFVKEFSEIIGTPAETLTIKTETFSAFNPDEEEAKQNLAQKVDDFIGELSSDQPFVFLKNNSGTYGLGITQVESGKDILEWSYKARKKMKAVKGGGSIKEVIIQEGIPTVITHEKYTAEPTIYLIGSRLAGGFLRAHDKKGPRDNLNSPGAIYEKLCVSDLEMNIKGSPIENTYGWIAKVGALAIGQEMQKMGATIR